MLQNRMMAPPLDYREKRTLRQATDDGWALHQNRMTGNWGIYRNGAKRHTNGEIHRSSVLVQWLDLTSAEHRGKTDVQRELIWHYLQSTAPDER